MSAALSIVFWLGGALLAYTFFGYAIIVRFLGQRIRKASVEKDSPAPSTVSVVIVVRNEAERIGTRIANLLDTDFPTDKLEIIVVSDGSTDNTSRVIDDLNNPTVHLLESDSHRGKPAGLNKGIASASNEIIVFADARQSFTRSTIPALVKEFADSQVGAVSGELRIAESASGTASGVDAYWKLEKMIRLGESRIDSSIGCTGAVYAVRKSAYQPLPEDTLIDDVVCPMLIALQDYRVLFCPEAKAYDPQQLDPETEQRRKRRTLAGNFQMLFRYPAWLLPGRNRLFLQLISHKYLRLFAPAFLPVVFAASLVLAVRESGFYLVATLAQCAFYVFAIAGLLRSDMKAKCFTLPAGFVFLNWMTLRGFVYYLRNRGASGW